MTPGDDPSLWWPLVLAAAIAAWYFARESRRGFREGRFRFRGHDFTGGAARAAAVVGSAIALTGALLVLRAVSHWLGLH